MTATAIEGPQVPEWDLADRMSKALRTSGLGVGEMGALLGVSRESVGRWLNDRGIPKRATIVAWAAITNVDLTWLETGECAIRDSNPEPAAMEQRASDLRVLALAWSVKPGLTPKLGSPHRPTRHLSAVS